jgi:tRNA(Arg) A34 adenosine deaminase TadA
VTNPTTAPTDLPEQPCAPEDAIHLRATFTAARQAAQAGNMPFGAALVKNGQMLWLAQNKQVTAADCTGHAEVVLVREARQALGDQVTLGATVYASGEPCAMCAGAMFWAGISRVIYGATTPDIEAALGDGPSLPPRCAEVLAHCRPAVEVRGPCLRGEALDALRGET